MPKEVILIAPQSAYRGLCEFKVHFREDTLSLGNKKGIGERTVLRPSRFTGQLPVTIKVVESVDIPLVESPLVVSVDSFRIPVKGQRRMFNGNGNPWWLHKFEAIGDEEKNERLESLLRSNPELIIKLNDLISGYATRRLAVFKRRAKKPGWY